MTLKHGHRTEGQQTKVTTPPDSTILSLKKKWPHHIGDKGAPNMALQTTEQVVELLITKQSPPKSNCTSEKTTHLTLISSTIPRH